MQNIDHVERPATLSETVRELAREQGISERTAWRRLAQLRADGAFPPRHRLCERCQRPLPTHSSSRRRFCSDTCRVSHYRQQPLSQPPQPTETVSLDEAAYLLGVSPGLLAKAIRDAPIPTRDEGNRQRIERAPLSDLFGTAQHTLPLVQAALGQAATWRGEPHELAELANHNPATLRRAYRQAKVTARLARAARNTHSKQWQSAAQLLLSAEEWNARPTRRDAQAHQRNADSPPSGSHRLSARRSTQR